MAHASTINLRDQKTDREEKRRNDKGKAVVSWSATEAPHYKHSKEWYLAMGIIGAGLAAFAVILKNYFFALFIVLAVVILFGWTKQKPKRFLFSITEKGIQAGNRNIPFSEIASFWIFEDVPHPYFILKPRKRLSPMIQIPLANVEPSELRLLLRPHLEETEEQESLVDVLARLFKI